MAIASLSFNTLGSRIGNRALIVSGLTVSACGFGVLSAASAEYGFVLPAVALLLLGAGGGLAMPAAVSALMGTVPAEQAGVGSALNDTIQQMGAALGIAVLGSVLAGTYTAAMPADAPEAARRSIADALITGDATLAQAAREAFTTAMSSAFMISAAGVLAAAVLALIVLRRKETAAPRPAAPADAPERELATLPRS
ncbi:hypothetical protein ACIBKY_04655 [Nonomuraea sp. NPDC050394]|uniref:hypothetical protein n=1 Tax=Nonomuraea sp. NPDC050394 TaxID=3364363 RepID=UPI00379967B0